MLQPAMTATGRRRHLTSFAMPDIQFALCGVVIDLARTQRARGRVSQNLFRPDCKTCAKYIWREVL